MQEKKVIWPKTAGTIKIKRTQTIKTSKSIIP
jgi:hypothetical protein